ncbi:MAG: hypothetical protein AAGA56_00680 [Myxococcota bacterium]
MPSSLPTPPPPPPSAQFVRTDAVVQWCVDFGDRIEVRYGDQLRREYAAGSIAPSDKIWRDGLPCWLNAAEVFALGASETMRPRVRDLPTLPPSALAAPFEAKIATWMQAFLVGIVAGVVLAMPFAVARLERGERGVRPDPSNVGETIIVATPAEVRRDWSR